MTHKSKTTDNHVYQRADLFYMPSRQLSLAFDVNINKPFPSLVYFHSNLIMLSLLRSQIPRFYHPSTLVSILFRPLSTSTPSLPITSKPSRFWTPKEDAHLLSAYSQHGPNWALIALNFPTDRTNRCIRQRYIRLTSAKTGSFSNAEIHQIQTLALAHPGQYTKIAKLAGMGRTGDQVRELLLDRLAPDRVLYRWTPKEDDLLRQAVEQEGVGKWANIAKLVPGRCDRSCLERWSLVLKPGLKKGEWSEEEDRRLVQAVVNVKKTLTIRGGFDFGDVAREMGGERHRKSCRERYERLVRKGKAESLKKVRSRAGGAVRYE